MGVTSTSQLIDFDRFSKYQRIFRTIAWVNRFRDNIREPSHRIRGELTAMEIQQAVDDICRLVQKEEFSREINYLESGHSVPQNSKVFALKPYLDDTGLLRVHGRTAAAADIHIGQDAKRPILFQENHRFSELLVLYHHQQLPTNSLTRRSPPYAPSSGYRVCERWCEKSAINVCFVEIKNQTRSFLLKVNCQLTD